MKTIFVKPAEVERKWFLIDAEGKTLGKTAVLAADILRGKNKPCYTPHQEVGDYVIIINADYVIIINAEKAVVTGGKETKKLYRRHSGFLGGLKTAVYRDVLAKKPTFPMEQAVKGMLPKGRLGRKLFTNLKVYAGAQHPHSAQKPEVIG